MEEIIWFGWLSNTFLHMERSTVAMGQSCLYLSVIYIEHAALENREMCTGRLTRVLERFIPWPLTVRPKRYRGRHFPCRTLVQFRANLVCRQYIWQRAVVLADIGDVVQHWTQCVILKL